MRGVVGTDLVGANAIKAPEAAQESIDSTVAGLCAAEVYTRSECARHDASR